MPSAARIVAAVGDWHNGVATKMAGYNDNAIRVYGVRRAAGRVQVRIDGKVVAAALACDLTPVAVHGALDDAALGRLEAFLGARRDGSR